MIKAIFLLSIIVALSNLVPDFFFFQQIILSLTLYNCILLLIFIIIIAKGKLKFKFFNRPALIIITGALIFANLLPYKVYYAKDPVLTAPVNRLSFYYVNLSDIGRDNQQLQKQIAEHNPDILLFLEVTPHWEQVIKENNFSEVYKYQSVAEDPSGYKMKILSRNKLLPVIYDNVGELYPKFIMQPVELPQKKKLNLLLWHAEQPLVYENNFTNKILCRRLAQIVRDSAEPFAVFGDFNAVPGSKCYNWFYGENMYPAARGYGYQKTWNADYWFINLFIDHIFINANYVVTDYRRLPSVGSDHFPQFVTLNY